MSEEKPHDEAGAATDAAAAPKKSPAWMLPAIALGALAVGAGAGTFLVGPPVAALLGGKSAAGHDAHASEEEGEDEGHGGGGAHGGGKGGKGTKKPMVTLDNIIVNPAGSASTRFLMASVAIELPDSKTESRLREQEAALRDVVIGALESRTLEQLAQPGGRDSVRVVLGDAIRPLTGKGKPPRIYLTQFVLQ